MGGINDDQWELMKSLKCSLGTITKKYKIRELKKRKKSKIFRYYFNQLRVNLFGKTARKYWSAKGIRSLTSILLPMFQWLQDMNWPGAELIYERLKRMPIEQLEIAYKISLSMAESTGDTVWKEVLIDFWND